VANGENYTELKKFWTKVHRDSNNPPTGIKLEIFHMVLVITSSSADIERLFSQAKDIMSPRKSRLNFKALEHVLLLSINGQQLGVYSSHGVLERIHTCDRAEQVVVIRHHIRNGKIHNHFIRNYK
jgi:hypothetical protein